ncbi:DNA polymerase I [Ornithinimicrobium tianjinense]|uniref:DNA polymerase I n=1 Tax=Ornithinimicrobium tianjinense TaxID=1195761 RepID=A0A917BNT5_9MICO|nr:DNA polymerase I [Ornithinimicrobium tianjinense]GGF48207.1 DNA polymerase I [Ornithinimicrobium tianjinense]
MSRLLLLDGHSLAYRAFFALPVENFSTSTGQSTNGVYGFTSMLINVLRDETPTHLAVAFDVSRQTFRTEQYAEYKAGRASTPSEFVGQVDLVKEVLNALRITHVQVDGFEADDVIATLTAQARSQGMEVLICSGDRDALQLVDDGTTLLYPRKGVSDLARMTPAAVLEKYGVPPERYSDLAALVGESSDNLPGVPGVGPKTAAKWITQFGDLSGIVDHADKLTGKAGQATRDHLDQVIRNRRLNQLVADVELPVTVDDLAVRGWDREEVHRVFDGLEFRVLRERLFATLESAEAEAEEGIEVEGTMLDAGEVAGWLSLHAGPGERVALVVQAAPRTPAGPGEATALGLAGGEHAAYLSLPEATPEDETALAVFLADRTRPKVLHEAKGQISSLELRGLPVEGVVSDTSLAAYLVRPDQRSYDLADLSLRYLRRELRLDEEDQPDGTLDLSWGDEEDTPADRAAARSLMVHARAVHDLSVALDAELADEEERSLLGEVELPLVGVLRRMEQVGIAVDLPALEALEREFGDAAEQAQQDAWEAIADDSVNLGSPKQLQVVLFETLGLPKTRRTKTGYTTDADALAGLYAQTEHPFLEALLRHRDKTRLRVTAEGLIRSVADDGRIHTTYQQTIAATGRLSSTEPNLQNIPIRTEEGRRLREMFVVGADAQGPYEALMSADYSQIEMRIMAHLSGDEGLIEAFRTGEDLHRFVGSRVFGVDPAEVTPEMRSKVKAMSYGLAYGLSAFGLSKQLGISTGEAKELMDEYFERFGGVRDYLRDVVAEARRSGFTETILGRRRHLPDLTSDNRQRREMAERMALNAPIQGSAADLIKIAMLRTEEALREAGVRSRMLLQVHDELVLEIAPGEREQVERIVREQMGAAADLRVPLDVSVGVGRSWHDAAH